MDNIRSTELVIQKNFSNGKIESIKCIELAKSKQDFIISFSDKIKEIEKIIILNEGRDFIKSVIRDSPRIGLTYNDLHFTIRVTIWEYCFGDVVFYLESWLDEKEQFFKITAERTLMSERHYPTYPSH